MRPDRAGRDVRAPGTAGTRASRAAAAEAGAATVLAVGVMSVLGALLLSALALGGAIIAGHRAAAAADLAALAAAARLIDGVQGSVCGAADALATANGARLTACSLDGDSVLVEVTVPVAGELPALPPAVARSRAGPAPN